jgi:hypothetical protein
MTTLTVAPAAPFNRAEHCRRIAAHGGATTAARHGTAHFRAIGRVGARVTIQRHGYAHFAGLVKAKGWHGRRPVSLAVDLAAGRVDALLAAAAVVALALTLTAGTAAAQDVTACYPAGETGEGFPVIACSDDTRWYADLDGDGRDPATNGRWVNCHGYC